MNLFNIIGGAFTMASQIKLQKAFVQENILPLLDDFKVHDDSLSQEAIKKITSYYGVGSIVLVGESLAQLRNKELSDSERLNLTYLASMTGLFDDFFDLSTPDFERIKKMIVTPEGITPKNDHEKLFLVFAIKVKNQIKTPLLQERAFKVFDAQMKSLDQSNPNLTTMELEGCSLDKGATSMVFYRTALNTPMLDGEEMALYKTGGLLQLCNDIFDVRKDLLEGVRTIATESASITYLKSGFEKEMMATFHAINQVATSNDAKKAFSRQIKFICAPTLVALNHYQKAELKHDGWFPQKLSRSELVCDMAKFSKRWQAGIQLLRI